MSIMYSYTHAFPYLFCDIFIDERWIPALEERSQNERYQRSNFNYSYFPKFNTKF